jgi:hypothetical protein
MRQAGIEPSIWSMARTCDTTTLLTLGDWQPDSNRHLDHMDRVFPIGPYPFGVPPQSLVSASPACVCTHIRALQTDRRIGSAGFEPTLESSKLPVLSHYTTTHRGDQWAVTPQPVALDWVLRRIGRGGFAPPLG